jgi:hypothetical protein
VSHHIVIACWPGIGELRHTAECSCGWLSPSVPEHVAVDLAVEHLSETEKEERSA